MTDTQQAAERLSDVYKTGDGCRVYGCPPDEAVERMRDDEVALLRAWLDPTPIDSEWLQSVGCEELDTGIWIKTNHSSLEVFVWLPDDNGPSVNFGDVECRTPLKSRGQFRRLASVLGLSLAEKETSE